MWPVASSATYYLHFICGHHVVHPADPTVPVTLKNGTTWEPAPSGAVFNGKSAHLFCPACSSSLHDKTGAPPSYLFSCGHAETSREALQMWWALQDAGLVRARPAGEPYRMSVACRGCEADEESLVLPLLKSWDNSQKGFVIGGKSESSSERKRIPLAELARVLVYAQRFRNRYHARWHEHCWLWSRICARNVKHRNFLKFMDIIGKFWGADMLLGVSESVASEYYDFLRRRIDVDLGGSAEPKLVTGAEKLAQRLALIKTLWEDLEKTLRRIENAFQAHWNMRGRLSEIKELSTGALNNEMPSMFKAGHALQRVACRSWYSVGDAIRVPEAELIKTSIRLDSYLRGIERSATSGEPYTGYSAAEVTLSIARAREEALRLWMGNTGILHYIVIRSHGLGKNEKRI